MPSSEKDNTEEELAEGQTNEDAWLSKVYNADSMLEVVEIFLTPELKEPRLYAHYDKELGQLFLSSVRPPIPLSPSMLARRLGRPVGF